jgi:hypothetical protein
MSRYRGKSNIGCRTRSQRLDSLPHWQRKKDIFVLNISESCSCAAFTATTITRITRNEYVSHNSSAARRGGRYSEPLAVVPKLLPIILVHVQAWSALFAQDAVAVAPAFTHVIDARDVGMIGKKKEVDKRRFISANLSQSGPNDQSFDQKPSSENPKKISS